MLVSLSGSNGVQMLPYYEAIHEEAAVIYFSYTIVTLLPGTRDVRAE